MLIVTADHGPAVAGAHNTIVCARAGKDLISSLVSGLLTIGPRFGGALDGAAQKFSWAYDAGMSAEDFVTHSRKQKELIMGIGHTHAPQRTHTDTPPHTSTLTLLSSFFSSSLPAVPVSVCRSQDQESGESRRARCVDQELR